MENYPKLDHTKTDVFREQVQYSDQMKKRLAEARKEGVTALRKIEEELGYLKNAESGVVVDLFLSYRAVKGWPEMVKLVEKMSPPLAATLMIQEQLGLALNRLARRRRPPRRPFATPAPPFGKNGSRSPRPGTCA
jgi:hypothetical protein